jgi:hypothetical protein
MEGFLMRKACGLIVVASFLSCSTTAIAAPVCGQTVGGPGETVVLDGNVGPCPGNGLNIATGTEVVDLAGFTVSCVSADAGIGIVAYDTVDRIEIRNGTVTTCGIGVDGPAHTRIVGMTLTGNLDGYLGGSCTDSTASGNLRDGMALRGGKSSGCEAHDNGADGISITGGAKKILLSDSSALNNAGSGIAVKRPARLTDIVASGNDQHGVVITATGAVRLDGVVTDGNVGDGVRNEALADSKILIRNSSADGNGESGYNLLQKTKVLRNTSLNNVANGIAVTFTADGSRIGRNTTSGNGTDLFDEQVNCGQNKWKFNEFVTSNRLCIK